MYEAGFRLQSFDELGDLARQAIMRHLVEALTAVNTAYLMSHNVPRLYASGVRYENPVGVDTASGSYQAWRDIPLLLASRRGTCMELAAWRLAEIRLREGYPDAEPVISFQRGPNMNMFHTAVGIPSLGQIEDPSANLGMGQNPWLRFSR